MERYKKYKVTVWSRLEDSEDKLTIFVPREELVDYISMMLINCMVVKIDGGVKEDYSDEL